MRFTLQARENQNTGELGWMDSRVPFSSDIFEPLSEGLGIAHDCLEHTAFGSVADEIEAHGAMYWVRYEGGWSANNGFTLDPSAFASEWQNLLQALMMEGYLPTPPKTRPLDEAVEEDISSIIEQGRAYCIRNVIADDPDRDEDSRKDLERIAEVFRAYFRKGYRNAVRRYKGLASCEVAALFMSIEKAFTLQRIEYEGQEIEVIVDLKTQRVCIEELIPEEY